MSTQLVLGTIATPPLFLLFHRKVNCTEWNEAPWVDWRSSTTFAAAVGVDESLGQLNTSILQAGLQSTVCTCQKVSVTDCNIEQEPKYVLVTLPAFEAYVVVASHLVVAMDSTHALVVAYHRLGCIDQNS